MVGPIARSGYLIHTAVMLKPSRRRWYHQAAVMERPLGGDGVPRPISWHLTEGGALRAVDELFREALCGDGHLELQEWFAAVPVQLDVEYQDLGEWFRPVGLTGRHRTA